MGGITDYLTEPNIAGGKAIPSMVEFDKSKTWHNISTFGFSPNNTIISAQAEYVPSFGSLGLVVVLGGYKNLGKPGYYDLVNITFFDPKTKQKYWQLTTGDIPSPRDSFCTAIFANPNGGYEIFVFGGVFDFNELQDAYVLSLPGFIWKQLPNSAAEPRKDHSCAVMGKRQVLTIGGIGYADFDDRDKAP